MIEYLAKFATISDDGIYRYSLTRVLSEGSRTILFVGLNPSTADALLDDPTIRRCAGFATRWGYNVLIMGNLYAFRSTNPKALLMTNDPIGPRNKNILNDLVCQSETVVAAWGQNFLNVGAKETAKWLLSLEKTKHLGLTKSGVPKHPLYLAAVTPLQSTTFCATCSFPCSLKFNSGDPKQVCENDKCRKIQGY